MTNQTNARTTKKTVSSARSANVGLSAFVKELSALLDKVEARLGPEAPALTALEKKRVAKPRKGAEKMLATLAPVVQQHGLDSPSLSATVMMSRLEDAQTLQPLHTRLQKIQKRVSDELFSAQGDAWEMGLQFYSLMKNRAKGDGELAQNLAPLTKMFAYRHSSVKAAKPTKVQTRAKANLKDAVALATRNDVPVGGVPHAGPTGGVAASVPAVQSAQPAQVVVAPATTVSAGPAATPGASAPGVVAATPAPSASNGVNGAAASGSHS